MSAPTREAHAAQYAAVLKQLLESAAPAFERLQFEEEPAGFVAAQRASAP